MHFLSICLHTTYVYASKDRHFWEKTLHTQIKTANIRNFIGKHPISFKFLKTAPTDWKEKCREIKQPPNQSIKRLSSYSKRDLNPHSRNGQGILSPSCLPIPPFEHPLERKTRLELATPTLARLCSTNWAISARICTIMKSASSVSDAVAKVYVFLDFTKVAATFFRLADCRQGAERKDISLPIVQLST